MKSKNQRWAARPTLLLMAVLLGLLSANILAATNTTLTLMTFNLRFASDTPPNSWPQRRPANQACIQQVKPDLIGTQEGVYSQLKDMAADQPEYAWIGLGRDGGSKGEFMAVFYRTNRLEPLEFDHYWLSDTPNVMASTTWSNTCRRMVTWVKFRDLQNQQQFYFINTHLDHQVQRAREKGAELIRQRITDLKTKLPVILVGDFNAEARKNKAYNILVEDGFLTDTWYTAQERRNAEYDSFHGYATPKKNSDRIDWILGQNIARTEWTEIVLFNLNGQHPSDHFPVAARVVLSQ